MGTGEAPLRALTRLGAAGLLASSLSACALSFPVGSLSTEDEITTSSVAPRKPQPLSDELGAEDWRRAKGAMGVALDPQGSGAQVSWDNPDTSIRGTFTPVGQPFVKSDEICRAFLATVIGQASTSSLQGTACRPSGGEWAIKDVKPFKKA